MGAIFRKEIRSYFTGITGYVFLGFFVLVTAFYFSVANVDALSPYYTQTMSGTLIMFLILVPVLTMRLFADEARQKTDQLLFTSPVTVAKIVWGKFFAAFLLFAGSLTVTLIFPLVLSRYGNVPFAETAGAFAGFLLMGACFVAVGLFISSLTESQLVAAVASFGALFLFFLIDTIAQSIPKDRLTSVLFVAAIALGVAYLLYDATKTVAVGVITGAVEAAAIAAAFILNNTLFDGSAYKVLRWLSLISRFSNFGSGVLNVSDVIYYVTFALAFVFLTVSVIEKRRYK